MMVGPNVLEELYAVHAGHLHVGHHDIEWFLLHRRERRVPRGDERHVPYPALSPQRPLQAVEDVRFVINKEDTRHDRTVASGSGSSTAWIVSHSI